MARRGLQSRLPEIADGLSPATIVGLGAGAEMIAQDAKRRVPVDTGHLRDAIHVEQVAEGQRTLTWIIAYSPEAWYGRMVEFGTRRAGPHPFLIPAMEGKRAVVRKLVKEAVEAEASGKLRARTRVKARKL